MGQAPYRTAVPRGNKSVDRSDHLGPVEQQIKSDDRNNDQPGENVEQGGATRDQSVGETANPLNGLNGVIPRASLDVRDARLVEPEFFQKSPGITMRNFLHHRGSQ